MANPATLSVGTRITVTMGYGASGAPLNPPSGGAAAVMPSIGGVTPPVQFGLGPELPMATNQNTPLPGLVQAVAGGAPDFVGSVATIFDLSGKPWAVTMGVFQTTWVSAGSNTAQRHWNYVDLGA